MNTEVKKIITNLIGTIKTEPLMIRNLKKQETSMDVSKFRVALMMEAVRTSETSVHFNVTTWRYIPEDSKLHTRRCENLKSHTDVLLYTVFSKSRCN
jgi:hypothetical protein